MLNINIKKEEVGYLRLLIDLAKLQYESKINESKQAELNIRNIKATA
jgi:hypothetical protein